MFGPLRLLTAPTNATPGIASANCFSISCDFLHTKVAPARCRKPYCQGDPRAVKERAGDVDCRAHPGDECEESGRQAIDPVSGRYMLEFPLAPTPPTTRAT